MLGSLESSAVIHLIGHISMMQMFSFNFGLVSVSGAHFRPESVHRFIYSIQIGHFVLRRLVFWDHWEVVL